MRTGCRRLSVSWVCALGVGVQKGLKSTIAAGLGSEELSERAVEWSRVQQGGDVVLCARLVSIKQQSRHTAV